MTCHPVPSHLGAVLLKLPCHCWSSPALSDFLCSLTVTLQSKLAVSAAYAASCRVAIVATTTCITSRRRGLSLFATEQGYIMVHPDILQDEQWAWTSTKRSLNARCTTLAMAFRLQNENDGDDTIALTQKHRRGHGKFNLRKYVWWEQNPIGATSRTTSKLSLVPPSQRRKQASVSWCSSKTRERKKSFVIKKLYGPDDYIFPFWHPDAAANTLVRITI